MNNNQIQHFKPKDATILTPSPPNLEEDESTKSQNADNAKHKNNKNVTGKKRQRDDKKEEEPQTKRQRLAQNQNDDEQKKKFLKLLVKMGENLWSETLQN